MNVNINFVFCRKVDSRKNNFMWLMKNLWKYRSKDLISCSTSFVEMSSTFFISTIGFGTFAFSSVTFMNIF